jgi:hypothetical protein
MLNLKKFVQYNPNLYSYQKMGIFAKLRERYNNLKNRRQNEMSDDETQDIAFNKFTQYMLERKEYKWKDYELQIEVILY